ncbi:MAG TPA: hypothetical protein VM165_15870 [Planctomycetaceae bacterium]|nr:hypothetical protein [Planctomycetaceae bacterium]
MDSQHRHQLQQNDLGQIALHAKPWLEQHGAKLIAAIVGVVIVVVATSVWLNSQTEARSEAWTKLSTARSVDEYGKVVDEFPGSLAAAWAALRMGELNLESGVAALFADRELALKDLETAKKEFDQVLNAKVELPDNVRERAMFGQAHCLESLCDGDTGPVIDAYQALLTRFPTSIYKTQVETRIKELQAPGAKEFYAWFHKQTPKPAALPRPQDGSAKPGASTTPGGDPFAFPPAAAESETTPADQKPAENAPAEEKPATESEPK